MEGDPMTERGFKMPNLSDLTEVARLTVNGRLGEATELIQRKLSGHPSPNVDQSGSVYAYKPVLPERFRQGFNQILRGLRSAPIGKNFGDFGFQQPRPDKPSREDQQFVERTFTNTSGSRDYKLFIPTGHSGPRPLLIMLHGCTQSPEDFAAGTRMNELAQQDGVYVAYPRQTRGANAQKCWNWFETRDQGREHGESGIIAGLTRAIIAEHPIDPACVYIAGLSAGGAAAANIAQAYPDIFAGVGVHSGLAAGCARDLSSALMAMRAGAPGSQHLDANAGFGTGHGTGAKHIPAIVFHGSNDATVNPKNGQEVLTQAGIGALEAQCEETAVPGGHRYARTRYRDGRQRVQVESWIIANAGHAWSGGSKAGSYTDQLGPDASRAMLDFFAQHRLGDATVR